MLRVKKNRTNEAFCASEKVTLQAMDHLLWSLNILVHFYRARGSVDFTLSTGEVLSGRVSDEWTSDGPFIQVTSLDLKSAYKQLALSPCDYNKTVVTIKNPASGQLECFLMNVMPFGASASVLHFLRVSTFLHAVGCALGSCWACYFDDFPVASHARASASALASTKGMLRLLGFEFGLEKLQPFASHAELLGVLIDLSEAGIGAIHVRNKPSRVEELRGLLDAAIASKKIVPVELPSFLGKLQYADAQLFGRAGKIALSDLREMGHLSRYPVFLEPPALEALETLRDRLLHGKPRTIQASWREAPFLVFTDGALESDATIGGCLFAPDGSEPEVFGVTVPPELLLRWRSKGAHHVIGIVELFAVIVALRHWRHILRGRRSLIFIDNWGALDVLVRGTANVSTWRELLLALENPQETVVSCSWFARVPSKSNLADGPSRACLDDFKGMAPKIVVPSCPLTKRSLKSFF